MFGKPKSPVIKEVVKQANKNLDNQEGDEAREALNRLARSSGNRLQADGQAAVSKLKPPVPIEERE